jgi:4-carboxymuconolactone decarboxylase
VDEDTRKKTQETAKKLWTGGIKIDPPYLMWKEFDRNLANDLSLFITGNLYSRTVLTLPERQMAACAMLAALGASDELKLHVNAALNVGCDPKKLAEVFFQLAPYGGMPLVNKALEVFREVLKGRGEWESFKSGNNVSVANLENQELTFRRPEMPSSFLVHDHRYTVENIKIVKSIRSTPLDQQVCSLFCVHQK